MSDELGELRTVIDDTCAAVSADEAIERSRGAEVGATFHRPGRSPRHLLVVGAAAALALVVSGALWQQTDRSRSSAVRAVPERMTSTTLGPSPTLANGCPEDMPEEFLTTSSLPFDKSIYLTAQTCGHMMMVGGSDPDEVGWVSIDEIAEAEADVDMVPVYDDRGSRIAWWARGQLGWIDLDEAAAPGWDVRSAARAEEDEMLRIRLERGLHDERGRPVGMRLTAPPSGLRVEEAVRPEGPEHDMSAQRLLFVPSDSALGVPARLELTFVVDQRAEETLAAVAEQRGATVTEVSGRPFVIYDDNGERVAVWAQAGAVLVSARSVGIDDSTISSLAGIVTFI